MCLKVHLHEKGVINANCCSISQAISYAMHYFGRQNEEITLSFNLILCPILPFILFDPARPALPSLLHYSLATPIISLGRLRGFTYYQTPPPLLWPLNSLLSSLVSLTTVRISFDHPCVHR